MPTFQQEIHSPRRGHDDTYSFVFEHNELTISTHSRQAVCTWRENRDPAWSGEPLEQMLANENICPPEDFSGHMSHLWQAWRRGELQDSEAEAELQALVTWLNAITRAKPRTDFWRRYF